MVKRSVREFCFGEPDAHLMTRRSMGVVLILLCVSLVAGILLFIFARPLTYLAIISLILLLVSLAFTSFLEHKSRGRVLRSEGQSQISREEVEMNVQYAGIYMAMALILLFIGGCFIVAATFAREWSTVGGLSVVLFLMSGLILVPYLSLFIRGAAQDERKKLEREALPENEVEGGSGPPT